jgi:hypothetical protein
VIPNQDSAFQGFTLNQNISSLSFLFADGFGPPGSGGYGVAIAVPEPATTTLAITGIAGLWAYRRKFSKLLRRQPSTDYPQELFGSTSANHKASSQLGDNEMASNEKNTFDLSFCRQLVGLVA